MSARIACLFVLLMRLAAQDSSLTVQEKLFQESLANVALVGYYTNGNGGELKQDRYLIEKISKASGKLWKFDVRIQYNGKDMPLSIPVPIEWAGDTPVVSLTNMAIPGSGTFTARVLFYDGAYAGTWSRTGGTGGKMFGTIQKTRP